jgi:O-antigen ligase
MWVAIAVGTAAVIVAILALPDLTESVLGRFNSDTTANSDAGHLAFLLLALNLWPQAPVFGVGLGNYEAITGIAHAHNVYASTLAELGVVGLFSLLCWVASVIWYGANAIHMSVPRTLERAVAVGLLSAYVSVLVNNLFQQSFFAGFFWLISGAVGALYYVARSQRATFRQLATAKPRYVKGASSVIPA